MVPIAHEQNIICSKTRLDGTTHEQTIICRQLFAGHVMDSRPIGREEKTHRMIIRHKRQHKLKQCPIHMKGQANLGGPGRGQGAGGGKLLEVARSATVLLRTL